MQGKMVDTKLVDKKSRQINNLLNGMMVPDALAALSCSILNLVANISCDYDGFTDTASEWLDDLSEKVSMMGESGRNKGIKFN